MGDGWSCCGNTTVSDAGVTLKSNVLERYPSFCEIVYEFLEVYDTVKNVTDDTEEKVKQEFWR